MSYYTVEQDEVLKARAKTLTQQKPMVVPESSKEKKKAKRRRRKNLSTKALRRVKKLERQGTILLKDAPPNVVGLRRKPRRPTREKTLYDYGIVEDTRSNQEIMDDFLS